MKVLAVILLVVAAVNARSTGLQRAAKVSLGENPSVVHIRLAVGTSGYLNSCVGSLINDRWVLTSKQCVNDSRFIWLRYGVVEVIKPELVTESSTVTNHPTADLALISINREVGFTDNISPIALASGSDELAESGKVCGFGQTENGNPGERLACVNISIKEEEGLIEAESDEGQASKYDIGAALVVDGKQVGVLVDWKNGEGAIRKGSSVEKNWQETPPDYAFHICTQNGFLKVADYLEWIERTIGQSY